MAFCSCENKDQTAAGTADSKPAGAYLEFSFEVLNNEMSNLLDLSVEYYDADGTVKTEALTGKSWSKKVTATTLPATLGFRVKAQLKAAVEGSSEVTLSFKYAYNGLATTKDGKQAGDIVSYSKNPVNVGFKTAKDFTDAVQSGALNLPASKYTFNVAGVSTRADWE